MSISIGGLISGIDTNSMIDQLLEIQQQPIVGLQADEAAYEVKLSTYGNLQNSLDTLKTAMENLESADNMASFSATSGNTDLFTASADENSSIGSYSISVTQLADVHKLTSTAFSTHESLGEGTIHLKVGEGSTADITISTTDTLENVAQAINDAEAGVNASVIFDGTNSFLALAAQTPGASNTISLKVTDNGDSNNTDSNGLSRLVYDTESASPIRNLSNTQDASDAIISVDGVVDIHRESNLIEDVIQGVTLNLKSASSTAPDNTTTLSVERNRAAMISGINSFINAYNDVLDFIDDQQSYDDTTGTAGVLLGDSTTNNVRNRLKNIISGSISGAGSVKQLSDIGIELNSDGRLELDSELINNSLDDNFDDVVQFLTQSSDDANGFSFIMTSALDSILNTTDGTLTVKTEGIQESINNIEKDIETLETRNLAWEERTRAQYNAMELLLAEYQTTGDFLTQQIVGFQNLNSYVSGGS